MCIAAQSKMVVRHNNSAMRTDSPKCVIPVQVTPLCIFILRIGLNIIASTEYDKWLLKLMVFTIFFFQYATQLRSVLY